MREKQTIYMNCYSCVLLCDLEGKTLWGQRKQETILFLLGIVAVAAATAAATDFWLVRLEIVSYVEKWEILDEKKKLWLAQMKYFFF